MLLDKKLLVALVAQPQTGDGGGREREQEEAHGALPKGAYQKGHRAMGASWGWGPQHKAQGAGGILGRNTQIWGGSFWVSNPGCGRTPQPPPPS